MKIGILGTRGIPNYYGGFEQFADIIARKLVDRGHELYVYSSSSHPYQGFDYEGVSILHCKDPEDDLGTFGQFIYDFNCILDSRQRNFDIILQLGYTSSSIWGFLLPKKSIIITNMDGLEWKRTKFSTLTRKFIKWAEKIAVSPSDYLVSDSIGIQKHLKSTYNAQSIYIPYGAEVFDRENESVLAEYYLKKFEFDILVARLEPENSIEEILDGFVQSRRKRPFVVVGKHHTTFGTYLKNKYSEINEILFVGGIYDQDKLSNLRYFSNLYFHGHTVGGTNPSLLEAMGCRSLIVANDNIFNKAILGDDSFYFKNKEDVAKILDSVNRSSFLNYLDNNELKISSTYSWNTITDQYENLFKQAISSQ